jgi:hypothetical protein
MLLLDRGCSWSAWSRHGRPFANESLAPAQTIPLDDFILTRWLQMILVLVVKEATSFV